MIRFAGLLGTGLILLVAARTAGAQEGKPFEPVSFSEAERRKCEPMMEKLAAFFKEYGQKVLDAKVAGMLGGTLPEGARIEGSGWPDPLEACVAIQRIFASDRRVRSLRMRRYSYRGLSALNQRINRRLERGGFHAYFSEQPSKGRVQLVCVAGERLDFGRDGPLKIWGKRVETETVVLGSLQVRYPPKVFEKKPSFTSDRGPVYHLREIHRPWAKKIWNRLEFLRKKKVDLEQDEITSELALSLLKGLDGLTTKFAFGAWRRLFAETRKAGNDDEARDAFIGRYLDTVIRDLDLYESVQRRDLERRRVRNVVDVKTRAALAQIAHALNPLECLRTKAVWLSYEKENPYRRAADKLIPALLDALEETEQAQALLGPAKEDDTLLHRLQEAYRLSPDVLRNAATEAFDELYTF